MRRFTFAVMVGSVAALLPALARADVPSITVTVPGALTLATSGVEVEAPATVTCAPIGAIGSFVSVQLHQGSASAGSGHSPLTCDNTPHTYLLHLFATGGLGAGVATVTANAEAFGQNFVDEKTTLVQQVQLAVGNVAVTASAGGVTATIDGPVRLFGSNVSNPAIFGSAYVAVDVTCPASVSGSTWLTVAIDQAQGQGVTIGSSDPRLSNQPEPNVVCDGVTHTYTFFVGAQPLRLDSGWTAGPASVGVYIDNTPDDPTAASPPADAAATVLLATDVPQVTAQLSPALNQLDWANAPVLVTWSVTDPTSGITSTSGCGAATVSSETAGITLTCAATNGAGLTVSRSVTVRVDLTAPTINGGPTSLANANGWYNAPVQVVFACFDQLSGVATCSGQTTLFADGAGQTVSGTATDNAGNRSMLVVGPINVDRTPPAIAMSTPASTYTVDQVVTVTCSASDALSGLDQRLTACPNLSEPAYALGLGTHTLSGTAVDMAGNVAGASVTFTVVDTFDGLCRLTRHFETSLKWADQLCQDLANANAAQAAGDVKSEQQYLKQYDETATDQTGKTLTAAQASILVQLASHL